jgi:hypothetical protein
MVETVQTDTIAGELARRWGAMKHEKLDKRTEIDCRCHDPC